MAIVLLRSRGKHTMVERNNKVRFCASWLMVCCFLSGCRSKVVRTDDPRLTPLMNAASQNDLLRVHTLLDHGAIVGERTRDGKTALYEAIERNADANNLPLVDALLKAGADPNQSIFTNSSPLSISLTRDHANPAVTMRLLQAGAIVPRDCPIKDSEDSVLALATMDSSIDVMRELIARGAPTNCKFRGASALHWAALNNQADRVQLLLHSGADPQQLKRINADVKPANNP